MRGFTDTSEASYGELVNGGGRVWSWLEEDKRFERFAVELCATNASVWLVQMALLHAGMLSVYIEIEGSATHFIESMLTDPYRYSTRDPAPLGIPCTRSDTAILINPESVSASRPTSAIAKDQGRCAADSAARHLLAAQNSASDLLHCVLHFESAKSRLPRSTWIDPCNRRGDPGLAVHAPCAYDTAVQQIHPHEKRANIDQAGGRHAGLGRVASQVYVVIPDRGNSVRTNVLWRTFMMNDGQIGGVGSLVQLLGRAASSSPAVAALGYDWMLDLMTVLITSGLRGPQVVSI